ncbi:hypothetical protein [Maribacter hydrothermalis]|nr:hypothetical protein [Maribacter hydrothermalis]
MDNFSKRDVAQVLLTAQHKSEELKKTNGYECFKSIQVFRNSFFIYKHNYICWKKSLKNYYLDENNAITNSMKRHFRQRVLISKLHNVLSSSTTFNEMYNEKQLENSFHCFIKELRNFTIHNSYFPLSSHLVMTHCEDKKFESFSTGGFKVYLQKRIKEHPKWEGLKKAMEYLMSILDSINLYELLEKYDKEMNSFYNSYIINYLTQNKNGLLELIKETEDVHYSLLKIKKLPNYPLSSPELRYLKLIVNHTL